MSKPLTSIELMDIISNNLRELNSIDINDRNIGKTIARSKEIGNLAGKAISLSAFALEKQRLGVTNSNLLPEGQIILKPTTTLKTKKVISSKTKK